MDSKYKYTYEKTADYCYKLTEEERLKYIELYCLNKKIINKKNT